MNIYYVIAKGFRKIFGRPAINCSTMGIHTKIDVYSTLVNSSLGDYSYIGTNSTVLYAQIGKFCSISNYCAIGGGEHPIAWVSTSPVFNSTKSILKYRLSNNSYDPFKKTVIGNDVWIGSHCLIRGGINIADGAVVGMGSVVVHDIGPFEIWAGNPARFIRKRFSEDQIKQIIELKWWDWDIDKLKNYSDSFNNINVFWERING